MYLKLIMVFVKIIRKQQIFLFCLQPITTINVDILPLQFRVSWYSSLSFGVRDTFCFNALHGSLFLSLNFCRRSFLVAVSFQVRESNLFTFDLVFLIFFVLPLITCGDYFTDSVVHRHCLKCTCQCSNITKQLRIVSNKTLTADIAYLLQIMML